MKTIKLKQISDIKSDLELIGKTFKVLNTRERYLIRSYSGIEDGIPKTMAQIARNENISRERVRQIMSKAFEKIELVLKYEQ